MTITQRGMNEKVKETMKKLFEEGNYSFVFFLGRNSDDPEVKLLVAKSLILMGNYERGIEMLRKINGEEKDRWLEIAERWLGKSTKKKNKDIKNIVFLHIDALRFDCVGFQKQKMVPKELQYLIRTPTLDNLAEKSLVFLNAFSVSSYTTPAMASVLTGFFPPKHGVRDFYHRISPSAITLPHMLREIGYLAVIFSDDIFNFSKWGIYSGFEEFGKLDIKKISEHLNMGSRFIYIHLKGAHAPYLYEDPEEYTKEMRKMGVSSEDDNKIKAFYTFAKMKREYQRKFPDRAFKIFFSLYLKGVSAVDRTLKDLLELIDDDSLLVVFSDHGEGRLSRECQNFFGHNGELFEEKMRVVLLMKHKELGHKVIEKMVSLVDIPPTVLSFLGAQLSADGTNIMSGERTWCYAEAWMPEEIDDLYSQKMNWKLYQKVVREEKKKWVVFKDKKGWFDIVNDPYENELKDGFESRIEEILREVENPRSGETISLDERVIERLKALGYIE